MPPGRDQLRPMQRLVRIMALLDQAGTVGVARDDLLRVADYGDADPGSQLALDLKRLRQQGWQIDNVAEPGAPARYRMVTGDNRLRLSLTPAQLAALQGAVIMAERTDLAGRLGVEPAALPPGVGTAIVPHAPSTELTHALEAVRLRSRISFTYKGSRREVEPGAVRFQDYRWYLSGTEVAPAESVAGPVKHFAVNRMSATTLGPPGSALAPGTDDAGRRLHLHPLDWEVDEPTRVVVRTPADYVPDVEHWLQHPHSARPGDGYVDLHYEVTNRDAFRARLYLLGTRVTVPEPAWFREEMLAELRTVVGA